MEKTRRWLMPWHRSQIQKFIAAFWGLCGSAPKTRIQSGDVIASSRCCQDAEQCEVSRLRSEMVKGSKSSRDSAGLLLFRRTDTAIDVLLVHPGGPFWIRKDEGAWTIPKGEAAPGEDLLARARTEFEEELGFAPRGDCFPIGSVRQRGGKTVHAWAIEADLPPMFKLKSNLFEMEWPPRSGKRVQFPEVDRAEFFSEELARRKINPAQTAFIDRLREAISDEKRN